MTNVNKLVNSLITDFETIANEIVAGIKGNTTPEAPAKEEPTAPEAPETVEDDDFDADEELGFLLAIGEAVEPAWEAVEALREAETATDNGNHEAAAGYIAIADRYIRLADIFKETEVTFSL